MNIFKTFHLLCLVVGLPNLPYFTGDPVFQPLSFASRGGSRREEQISPYSVRQIVASLRRHCNT